MPDKRRRSMPDRTSKGSMRLRPKAWPRQWPARTRFQKLQDEKAEPKSKFLDYKWSVGNLAGNFFYSPLSVRLACVPCNRRGRVL